MRASRNIGADGRRPRRLALSGLILMASLAPPTAGGVYGETDTKSQAEVKAEVKNPDRNAGFRLEGVRGAGSAFFNDGANVKKLCKETGGTYTVFNGQPTCYKG